MSNLLTSAEAAARLGITKQTAITYATDGRLAGVFFGRRWKFLPEEIDRFIEAQRRGR